MPKFSPKHVVFIFSIFLIMSVLIAYFLYNYFLLPPKDISTFKYDTQQAKILLNDSQTIFFTRKDGFYLSNLKDQEFYLGDFNNKTFGANPSQLKISYSRKYLVWQTDIGIVGVNVDEKKGVIILPTQQRQIFDLSPNEDKMLFFDNNQLTELNLFNQAKKIIVANLPQLNDSNAIFNHAKYSPNAKLAYIRSVHKFDIKNIDNQEDAIIDLATGNVEFIKKGFSNSCGSAPFWSNGSNKLLAFRGGFAIYDLTNKEGSYLTSDQEPFSSTAYSLNPSNNTIVFIKSDNFDLKKPYLRQDAVYLSDFNKYAEKRIITVKDTELKYNFPVTITDVGWLDKDRIWMSVNVDSTKKDLWIIQKDSLEITKVLENINLYSLESVELSNIKSYVQ